MTENFRLETVLEDLNNRDQQVNQSTSEQVKTAGLVPVVKGPTRKSGRSKESAITAAIQRARLAAGDLSV